VSVIRGILDQYLYKEEVQQLAREIGLPVSRNKDEIIEELLVNPDFDPVDAVRFLRVWQLQEILRERSLPSGAARNELFDRVVALVKDERAPPKPRQRSKRPTAKETRNGGPVVIASPAAAVQPSNPVNIHFYAPLQDHAVPWGFVGVVSAGVFTGVFLILASALGPQWGGVVGIVACVLVAVTLLVTERRWAPFLGRLVRPEPPR
jgi:hypothetical protein